MLPAMLPWMPFPRSESDPLLEQLSLALSQSINQPMLFINIRDGLGLGSSHKQIKRKLLSPRLLEERKARGGGYGDQHARRREEHMAWNCAGREAAT